MTLGTLYTFFGLVLVKSTRYTQEDMPGTTGTFGKIFGIGSWSATYFWGLLLTGMIWVLPAKGPALASIPRPPVRGARSARRRRASASRG